MNTADEKREKRRENYHKYRALADINGQPTDYMVAKKSGLHNSLFSDWKRGKSEPKADKLIKIAEVLGVNVEELIS